MSYSTCHGRKRISKVFLFYWHRKENRTARDNLKQELAHWMINEYNNRVKAGEVFEPNKYYSGFLENFDVTFREVEKQHYPEYFGWARWLYKGDNFSVLQLIYPSTSGFWPWDTEAPDDYTWCIPRLYAN